jgi:tetratricopeptide (TPR) repeat protein
VSIDAHSEVRQALDALWEARRRISALGKTDWQEILRLLEPYRERRYLHGATRENADRILSLINAVVGDAYRELGKPHEAALAYRRAQEFFPGTGFQGLYAELALEHQLEDHYESALAALLDGESTWLRRSPLARLVGHVASLLTSPGTYWHFLRGRMLFSRRIKELRGRIAARSGHNSRR